MTLNAKTPDFLDQALDIERRTRNLETGVHKLPAVIDYGDIDPTPIPTTGQGAHVTTYAFIQGYLPMYRKYRGIVHVWGKIGISRSTALVGGEEAYGTLPEYARPTVAMRWLGMTGQSNELPLFLPLNVYPDGRLTVEQGQFVPTPGVDGPFMVDLSNHWPTAI